MYAVSADYQNQINKTLRNPSFMRIRFGITDPQAVEDSIITDNGHLPYSAIDNIDQGVGVDLTYQTLEHGRFILDGRLPLPETTNTLYQGYVGSEISGADHLWVNKPTITVQFSEVFVFAGLSFTFDTSMNDYPTKLRIKGYLGGIEQFNMLTEPKDTFFPVNTPIPEHDKLEIIFEESLYPYRRARLFELVFGLVKIFDNDTLVTVTHNREVDIMSTKLPTTDFSFTIIDTAGEYDPDNPAGLWDYLESQQQIKCEYGYELDNGSIEWILGGYLLSTGEVSVDSNGGINKPTFKATDSLNYLTAVYKKGLYRPLGISLFDLAMEVATEAGIAETIEIDVALKNVFTRASLPRLSIRECFQLIANAGMAVLDVTRAGAVRIYRPAYLQNGFKLDFSGMMTPPNIKKYPPLYFVNTSYVSYSVDSELSDLYNGTIPTSGTYEFEYQDATNIIITPGAGLTIVSSEIYSHYCKIIVIGLGELTIRGNVLKIEKLPIDVQFGNRGDNCPIENSLVTSREHAIDYANWIGNIVQLRNEYTVPNRGYPELDCTDRIYAKTNYTDNLSVILLQNKVTFDGALSATSKFLIGG